MSCIHAELETMLHESTEGMAAHWLPVGVKELHADASLTTFQTSPQRVGSSRSHASKQMLVPPALLASLQDAPEKLSAKSSRLKHSVSAREVSQVHGLVEAVAVNRCRKHPLESNATSLQQV